MNRKDRRVKPLRKHQISNRGGNGNPTLAVITVCLTALVIVLIAAFNS